MKPVITLVSEAKAEVIETTEDLDDTDEKIRVSNACPDKCRLQL